MPHSLIYQSEGQIEEHVDRIMSGWRPTIPQSWPQDLAAIIRAAWDQEPRKRPSFLTIYNFLKEKEKAILLDLKAAVRGCC